MARTYEGTRPKEYFTRVGQDFLKSGGSAIIPAQPPDLGRGRSVNDLALESVVCGRWIQLGMPTIRMSALVAAELVFADSDADVLDEVRAPWEAFMIEIPEGLFATASHVLVASGGCDALSYAFSEGPSGACLSVSFRSFRGLFNSKVTQSGSVSQSELAKMERPHLFRLIANVCVAATDPDRSGPGENLQRRSAGKRPGRKPWREPAPQATAFVLLPPLVIERTPTEKKSILSACRNLLRTGNPSAGVQTWVRGHVRNQVCGPRVRDASGVLRWTERRRIFVASHLRGSPDAPLAVHPHVLK